MASMKTMMMMAIDVAPSMGDPLITTTTSTTDENNGKTLSKLQFAKNFLSLFILQRTIASKTAEFGVITFGSDDTNNFLNSDQGGYEGINEVVPMARSSKMTLQELHNIEVGSERVDLIDSIVVAQDVLMRVNAGKAFNRIMLLITDGETEVEGVDDLETIVDQMKTVKNFGLYIGMIGKVLDSSSVVKKENAKLLKSLADSIGGRFMEIEELSDATHLLTGGLGLGTRPTLSKILLEWSPNLHIPSVYWSKVSKATAPTLKKQPLGDAAGGGDDEMEVEGSGDGVKRDITYRSPDNMDVEVSAEEKVKGYRYGAQYIPVTVNDEEKFKIPGPASVQVIGCIPREKIPRHHFLDSPSYLHPVIDNEVVQYAFGSLVVALADQGKVALARLVKRENSDPGLVALIPTLTVTPSLLMYRLPFVDDIREYNFPSLVTFANEKIIAKNETLVDQRKAMGSLIDSMTVNPVTKSAVTPNNVTLQTIYGAIHQHLLGMSEEDRMEVPDFTTLSTLPDKKATIEAVYSLFPLTKVEKVSRKKKIYWSDVDAEASTAAVDAGEGGGAAGAAAPAASGGGGAPKRAKIEIDLNQMTAAVNTKGAPLPPKPAANSAAAHVPATTVAPAAAASSVKNEAPVLAPTVISSSSSVPPPVAAEEEEEEHNLNLPDFTVGSPTPLEDFQALVDAIRAISPKDRKARILKAMTILTKIIQRNVSLGGSRTHYKRAVSCLSALREVSIAEKEFELFNTYLQTFKKNYQVGRHSLAWQLATDALLTLISKDEVKASNVSDDDAEQFLGEVENDNKNRLGEEEEDEGAV